LLLLLLASCDATTFLTSAGRFPVTNLDRDARRSTHKFSSVVNKFLLHTIEGSGGRCDYEGGISTLDHSADWPHFIVALDCAGNLRIGQFLSLQVTARALKSTGNRLGTIQVEIGGLAAKPFTDPNVFSHSAQIVEGVAALFQAVRAVYPAMSNSVDPRIHFGGSECTGTNSPCRVSESVFIDVSGLVGHQHAPGDSHWDPGHVDPHVIINYGSPQSIVAAPAPVGAPAVATQTTCTYNTAPGVCVTQAACSELGGQLAASSSGATGCEALAGDIMCCWGSSSGPEPAPAATQTPPTGPACTYKGHHGSCLGITDCNGGISISSSRNARGCESLPSNVLCCLQGVSPFEDVVSVPDLGASSTGATGGSTLPYAIGGAVAALVVILAVTIGVYMCIVRPARKRVAGAHGASVSEIVAYESAPTEPAKFI